jgi:hypothetical protein
MAAWAARRPSLGHGSERGISHYESRSAVRGRAGRPEQQLRWCAREVEIGRWEPDDPDEEYEEHSSATGSIVISCALPAAPDADETVGEKPLLLAEWAETLVGTTIEVTKRYDS